MSVETRVIITIGIYLVLTICMGNYKFDYDSCYKYKKRVDYILEEVLLGWFSYPYFIIYELMFCRTIKALKKVLDKVDTWLK